MVMSLKDALNILINANLTIFRPQRHSSRQNLQNLDTFAKKQNKIMKTVTTAADLGKAIKNGENEIAIEGDLAQKVIRIKATGNVAWAIALGAVTIGIAAVLASPGVVTGPAGIVVEGTLVTLATTTCAAAVAIWGVKTTVAAISIGVGGQNVKALRKLKDNYEITQKGSSKVIIRKTK